MNCNVTRLKPILIDYTDAPPELMPPLVCKDASKPPIKRLFGSNVISINIRKLASSKTKSAAAPTFQIEKEEIQEAMDCLLRLKAIITLRESDLATH